ncbi:Cytochrome P450 E-class group I protein [Dioscorea alata]|uniref:Cytochrome P450 E-class group I protein n=1 Tax=Dioscorea alata TaxID=55571 RepID=A0ACB7WH09_DIOAL|nr:Cytochrome P450 E-class group I protein [Dioscorea alata]
MDMAEIMSILGLFIVAVLSYAWAGKLLKTKFTSRKQPPEPSGALPIIGHLHQMIKSKKLLSIVLSELADQLGPVFAFRLGSCRTVVVSSYDIAKECYTTNDRALSSKPATTAGRLLAYNQGVLGFVFYGPYWRTVRRIVTTELLSTSCLETHKQAQSKEIDLCIHEIFSEFNIGRRTLKVELLKWVGDLNYNVVFQIVAGKRYYGSGGNSEEACKFRRAISGLISSLGVFVPSDMFPFLDLFDFGGHKKVMNNAFKELDSLLTTLLEEHKARRRLMEDRMVGTAFEDQDFMDIMLSMSKNTNFFEFDSDTAIKATCLGMVLGGTHTTTFYLTWAIALLLKHREILKKVQEEIDKEVGKERVVDHSDVKNLHYLQAVIKEAFRLCPGSSNLIKRASKDDCLIGGYYVPAGTHITVNIWKIQRDPAIWDDPLVFKPERFLTKHAEVDVRGMHYELLPFRSGRFGCPGSAFALQMMHLLLARFLQGFHLETPENKPVEINEALGIISYKTLDVLVTPRLPAKLYEFSH